MKKAFKLFHISSNESRLMLGKIYKVTYLLFVHLNGLHDHLGVPFENELQKLLLLVHLFVLHS
uniref:Ovule protein n=1 Tax=Schistosoma curassoni TaxID=6186 RepID=A0A183JHW3_9TREM